MPAAVASAPSYLGRLLDVISLVGEEPELTLAEVSQRAGIPSSTAHRLTALLLDRDFVRRDGDTARFSPGPRLLRLGLRSLARLQETGHFDEAVRQLSRSTNESVSLGLLTGSQIVLIARQESAHPLRMVVRVGDIIPAHMSAMGKAILAQLPASRRLALLRSLSPADGKRVLVDLEGDLCAVRERGYATDDEVFAVGLRCIAAPLFSGNGEVVGGISVAGPSARFSEALALACLPALLATTARVSRELGCDG
ncbi:MAG: IclR family transcriptional regulator [Chloroflexota bacterium]